MSAYPPPSFQSTIFDTNAFSSSDGTDGLTEAEANLLFYKYPLGQAFETLQTTDHTGLASFQAGIDITAGTLVFPDNSIQTTAFTGSSTQTLSQTLVLGNSAGSTDINMNNNDITNCASVSGLQVSTGILANNINIGNSNLNLTTTGSGHNIVVGDDIMKFITTANYNTMMGSKAGQAMISGSGNEGYGSSALQNNQTGSFNIAMGNRAGEKNLGSYNVFLGAQAGQNGAVASSGNTFVGQASGQNDTGSNNSYLGSGTSITGGVSGSTVIGISATTGIANTVQLGTTSTNVNCPNTLSVTGIITNAVAQPSATDSSTKVPTTAWVQGAITDAITNTYGLGTNILYQPGTSFTPSSNVLTTLGSQSITAGTWSITYSFGFNIDTSVVGKYAQVGISNTTSLQFTGKYGNAIQTIWATGNQTANVLSFVNGSTTLILTATTTIYLLGLVNYLGGGLNLGVVLCNSMSFTRIG